MEKIRCGLCGGAGCGNCCGMGVLFAHTPAEVAAAQYNILSQGMTPAADATEVLEQAAKWNANFFRHGAHPGKVTIMEPIDLRLSVVPWPAHLADLRQHPGDIVLQVNVGRTIDRDADVDAEHDRNHRLADAILEKLQPETMRIATALHEAMANVGRCDECDTVWVGDGICPYCAGFEDGEAEADAARRATEFAVKQQQMLGDQLELRDRDIRGLMAARDIALSDASHYQQRVTALLQRLDAAADEVVRLRDQQARLRTWATQTLAATVATLSAGALAWCCWDRLPHGSPSTWWTVVLVLGALLVGRRWRARVATVAIPRAAGPETRYFQVDGQWYPTNCRTVTLPDGTRLESQELPGGNPGTIGPDSGKAAVQHPQPGPPRNTSDE